MKQKKCLIAAGAALTMAGIAYIILHPKKTTPKGLNAVTGFNKKKYLGRWYEITRLECSREKNLQHITAEYSLNKDGSVKVVNRGYNFKKHKMEKMVGRARFTGDENIAHLKVSFGLVHAGYNIIAIDKDYKYALVAGDSFNCLWLLSREKIMPENITSEYLQIAQQAGFSIEDLVWVRQK
ncbi:lipocalin family protein [Parafilimonas sp.]|uniref:lipocalin family protein n=1 Tax=Parafilimonas sp. TaxID=1969739 RepID=UPI0039E3DA9E